MPASTAHSSPHFPLKKSYQVERTIEPVYTGGKVALTADESTLLSTVGDTLLLTDLKSGLRLLALSCDDDSITCFAVTPDAKYIVTASQSLLLRLWNGKTGELIRSWKAHEAPVLVMDCDPTSTLVATGSADSTIKVWDLERGYCTHNLKGHSGVISALKFHPNHRHIKLVSGSDDSSIRVWDLLSKSTEFVLDEHVSVVRGLDFSLDGKVLVSGGRDQVIMAWNLQNGELIKTVPVFESVEDVKVIAHPEELFGTTDLVAFSGGECGMIKFWNMVSGEAIIRGAASSTAITSLLYLKNSLEVGAIMSDQNIMFYGLNLELPRTRQIAGYNEDVLDALFVGPDESRVAVVTNTDQIRVYDLETSFCDILTGHTDMVLGIARSKNGDLLVSGSKDKNAILWRQEVDSARFDKIGQCSGHTEAVSAVAFSQKSAHFVVTGSQDLTIKLWDIQQENESASVETKARFTIKAHDKGIQSVTVAPNDRIFASSALDKTAKIWSTADGSLLGVLKGHIRGVWCVRFSPTDQVVATSSTDKTVKLWSLSDFSCIQTFEGHLNSVLHLDFLSSGMQLASSGSDGLVKIWTLKDGECGITLDNHEDKIWALAKNSTETRLVSGSADSRITIWKDTTSEDIEKEDAEFRVRVTNEQDLSVFLLRKDYKNAIHLALKLQHPMKLLSILKSVSKEFKDEDSILGLHSVDGLIQNLDEEQLGKLLLFARDWNTSTYHSFLVQSLLRLVLKSFDVEKLISLPRMKEVLESLLPYTERHFDHASALLQQSYLLDFTLFSMQQQ